MGILDEAIRDHLELKRQHGAESDELKRLEDEAFGPPTRPGEPDFPESGAAAAESAATSNGELGPGTEEEPAAAPTEGPSPTTSESESLVTDETPSLEGSPAQEPAEHPAIADSSEAETTLYDHSLDEELDFGDVGLTPEEEAAGAEGEPPRAPSGEAEPEPPPDAEATGEPPIESLETVEHPLEPESGEHEVPSDELAAAEPASEELELEEPASEELELEEPAERRDDDEEEDPESSEEDVLADTPEFLRDAPEDDELWFEQGEPKDFDFD